MTIMKRLWIIAGITAVVLAAQLIPAGQAYATKAIANKEDAACTACHDKPGSKLMTDKGKYYELMGSFDGYDQVTASFGKCTACHVRKPGSAKLTKQGKQYQSLATNMEGLREYLMEPHPTPPAAEPDQSDNDD
jgi:hypothetical protein